ncbi:MAG: AAA domain-containing protein [Leucobacter sp.]|nr:AAA domain-containing protein [Leucobacter sp.]
MNAPRTAYPFSAIVGQQPMKLALLLNAIDPQVGGVLVRGSKGSAKSTAVRALAEVLPSIEVVRGCPIHSDPNEPSLMSREVRDRLHHGETLPTTNITMPVVELPIGATEDRVTGSLDMAHMLRQGERRFEPGILAAANRGILYVDEVNLLDDHVVDVLLDSAAMGVNTVERDGISYSHPARFVLVGTMNPEEGDLRPQLLDRFGLAVDVASILDAEQRLEILERRLAFESDSEAFAVDWEAAQSALRVQVSQARELLPSVQVPRELRLKVAQLSISLEVEGHRADTSMIRAAAAVAALAGREQVQLQDLHAVAELVYGHRMRRLPFEDVGESRQKLLRLIQESLG